MREMIVTGRAVHADVERIAKALRLAQRRLGRFEYQYDRVEELRSVGGPPWELAAAEADLRREFESVRCTLAVLRDAGERIRL